MTTVKMVRNSLPLMLSRRASTANTTVRVMVTRDFTASRLPSRFLMFSIVFSFQRSLICSRSSIRWLITLICSSTTGTRWAKWLCSRTSRVNSSSLASVTAWVLLLAMSTPISVKPPVMRAHTIVSVIIHSLKVAVLRSHSDAFRRGLCAILPVKEVVHMTAAQKQAYEELYYMTVEILDELDALKHKIAQQQKASEALWDLPED
nr:MAG TPA: hypothetical protein [Caudoviricetes sp.]